MNKIQLKAYREPWSNSTTAIPNPKSIGDGQYVALSLNK